MNSLAQNYPHLEISVLKLSEVLKDNPTKRMDAEYFKREYVEILESIKQKEFIQLKDTDITIKHPTEIKREYVEKGVWFIRVQNVKPLVLDTENKVFISFKDADTLCKNVIQEGDILMNRTGSCGDCVLYLEKEKAIASSHVFVIRNTFFNQAFLSVFFNTRFGYLQIQRGKYGSVQPEIAPTHLKNIYVSLLPLDFQEYIAQLVKSAHHALEQSKSLYKEAQELLEQELGTLPPAPPKEHSIKTLKESFLSTGRLDAEFYQHKYAQIEDLIKNYKGGVCTLTESEICDAPFEPQSNTTYRYVELAHVGNYGNILTPTEALGAHLPTRARRLEMSCSLVSLGA
ncbi:restriction endonuclease subunit S [Helicobacter bizzozeronii]|uniref:restriction endonuclease subunit S n=1 Tax=Helicobacter bizzozeronii TaxID=56877 RepID=UPI000CF1561C|nr:restriction endonuclease subunit S [Helicobacter bizzozeronii]